MVNTMLLAFRLPIVQLVTTALLVQLSHIHVQLASSVQLKVLISNIIPAQQEHTVQLKN
jgi:hypothetical protein